MEEKNKIVKEFDEEMTNEDVMLLMLQFVFAGETEIEGIKNDQLIEPCHTISNNLYKTCKNQLKSINKSQRLNNFYNKLGGILNISETREEYDKLFEEIKDNLIFEKNELKDIKYYVKVMKKIKEYKDMPLLYVTMVGILKYHNETIKYFNTKSEIFNNELNHIGYIPAKKYDLPNEDYKTVIELAIDRLYHKQLPLFIESDDKIKKFPSKKENNNN